ncbi:PIR Superfamily Protein [Plasmodium ovale wallikeri]|uniref:PIR Superfamily Protein n=1 Tax=Plasmodium ovale wallikeri TaxID=864142 RepID=A0A1A9A7Y1_PLAOA|nr:PIR Superfamily Protein [Plasmodium ovale wallikeri]SBT57041.1 PIR Superfamily Protein [Plasmodium ovale wallikeri]
MVHVIYDVTANGGGNRGDECFEILSTIQSTAESKIAELDKTNESEGNFLEKCKDLDEYLKNYNKDNKDCYEGEFTFIYESVKYTINEEIGKSTNYSKCIEKLKPKKQDQVGPEDATKKSDKEKQDSEVSPPEGRSQSLLSSDKRSEETERLGKHKLPDQEQTEDQELDAANQQITLEPSENGIPPHSSGVLNEEESQNQVDAHGSSDAKDTVASGKSTAANSASNELGDHQRTSQDGTLATADPKEAPSAQGLDSGELSSAGLAKPDEPASKDVLTVPDGPPPDSQESPLLHRPSCLRASTGTGESPPVCVELITNVQSHTDCPIQQKGQELEQKAQQEQSSDHVLALTELPSSTDHVHPHTGSSSFGTSTDSRGATPLVRNNLEGGTDSGLGSSQENSFMQLPMLQTPEGESDRSSIKMYIIIGVIIFAVILLFILLFKYAWLRGYFSKKKKKKRQMIQEELDRLMYSPSIFDEKNMYLPYTQLDNLYCENEYEY